MKYRIIFIFLLFLPICLYTQDVHFSNNGIISTFINPAYTGAFRGNIRASAVYRDQFSSFIENPYRTTILSVDSPIAFGLKENHWIGVGVQLYSDKAGDLALNRTGYGIGGSYHLGLDNDFNSVITLGFNYGSITSNLDPATARYASPGDPVNLNGYKHTQTNIAVGVKFKTPVGKDSYFESGIALQRLSGTSTYEVDNNLESRINVNMLLNSRLSKKIRLTPEFYFSKSSNFTNMSLHLFPEFIIGKANIFTLRPGVGMRFGDAMIMHLGGLYKGWKVNVSYDMTVSSASTYNNNYGGFEIGIQRIFIINRKPKTKLKLICPRL